MAKKQIQGSAAAPDSSSIGPGMNAAEAEAYKQLRTNLMYAFPEEQKNRVIGLTSSLWDEGKSVAAIDLAYVMAETEKKILLIEADMRMPVIAQRMGFSEGPGLADLLAGMNNIGGAVKTYEVSLDERDISFDVMVAGAVPPDPSEMLGSERMKNLLKRLRERYDYVLIDLPPAAAVTDAVIASHLADGMVIVVQAERTVRDGLAETMRRMRLANANVLGFVFCGGADSAARYYKGSRK